MTLDQLETTTDQVAEAIGQDIPPVRMMGGRDFERQHMQRVIDEAKALLKQNDMEV